MRQYFYYTRSTPQITASFMFEVINTPICPEKLRFVEFVFGIPNFRGFTGQTRQPLRDLNACNIACYISFDVFSLVLPDYDTKWF